jgi:hypothetical protein
MTRVSYVLLFVLVGCSTRDLSYLQNGTSNVAPDAHKDAEDVDTEITDAKIADTSTPPPLTSDAERLDAERLDAERLDAESQPIADATWTETSDSPHLARDAECADGYLASWDGCSPACRPTPDGGCEPLVWFDQAWRYRKKITIAHTKVTSDLQNLPVLIATTDPDLTKLTETTAGFVFTAADQVTPLAWEIEDWFPPTGSLTAWVRVPLVSASTDTVLYLYYGNASATDAQNPASVWDANYAGVWHLNNDPSGGTSAIKDSTAHANHGTSASRMGSSDRVPGKIGGAIDFSDPADLINMGRNPTLNNLDPLTLEGWFCMTGGPTNARLLTKQSSSDYALHLSVPITSDAATKCTYPTTGDHCIIFARYRTTENLLDMTVINKVTPALPCTWSHVAVTLATSQTPTSQMWVDGVEATASLIDGSGGLTDDSGYDLILGNLSTANRAIQGQLDEWRVSNTVRSADWIKTSYANQSDPTTFYTVGSEETGP